MNQRDCARQLLEQGYCVVRVFSDEETHERHQQLHHALYNDMPEYLPGATLFVRGGFGALGNASSFHLPIVRQLRREAHRVAEALFKVYKEERSGSPEPLYFEQLVDRVRVLKYGAEIKEEVWHRDYTPTPKYDWESDYTNITFGGWISLNGIQRFSAIKGSHLTAEKATTKGFAPLSKEEQAKYTEQKHKALESNQEWYIDVPPGHMLIFQQEMIHEVVGGKHKGEEQLRLFTGWRLSSRDGSFVQNSRQFFDEQGVTRIKSHQLPDMYPDMPWSSSTASRRGLAAWSAETFWPYLLEQRSVVSGAFKGETHTLVPKHMYSLYEVTLKRAAWRVMQEMQSILDERGLESFVDEEEQARFEAAQIMATMPPTKWEELHIFKKSTYGPLVGPVDYFEIEEQDRVMFEPYTEAEKRLYELSLL